MVFTGTYEHSIDSKQRLAVPAEIRAQVQRAMGGATAGEAGDREAVSLYVTLGEEQSLCLYTEPAFEQRARELDGSELDSDELLAYERLLFSLAKRVEIDKQGRVRLPENLLSRTGLSGDVVLLGVKDHLEIRDRQQWMDHVERTLREHPGVLMNPRRAMRQKTSKTPPDAG